MLGRPLRPGEIPHHENEDKTDNREANLRVMSLAEHNRLHHRLRVDTACGHCGAPMAVVPSQIARSKSGLVFCSSRCSGLAHNVGGVTGRPLTPDENDLLARLRARGWSWNAIGRLLGRNRESIRVRGLALGG